MAMFEELVERAVRPGPERVLAGCVCVVMGRSGVIYERAFGTQSVDEKSPLFEKPMGMDTTMWIASCTKLITAVAVMQCVERGALDLDADIAALLPEWKGAKIFKGFEESGRPILETAEKGINLRMLMTHSSGLGYIPFDPMLQKWAKSEGRVLTDESSLHDLAFTPLVFEPGEAWRYGVGLEWAGQLVERVNGNQRLGDYMQQHIWGPLGMKFTSFQIKSREDILSRRADMTMRDPRSGVIFPSPSRVWPEYGYKDDHGGGGAFSCPGDYIKILSSLIMNDGKLLKSSSIDTLCSPNLSASSKAAFNQILFAPYPGNENGEMNLIFSGGLPQSADLTYALGGNLVQEDVEGRRKKGSIAWGGMPNLQWVLDRKSGLALFYASQLMPPGDRQSCEMFQKFEEAAYAGKLSKEKL